MNLTNHVYWFVFVHSLTRSLTRIHAPAYAHWNACTHRHAHTFTCMHKDTHTRGERDAGTHTQKRERMDSEREREQERENAYWSVCTYARHALALTHRHIRILPCTHAITHAFLRTEKETETGDVMMVMMMMIGIWVDTRRAKCWIMCYASMYVSYERERA